MKQGQRPLLQGLMQAAANRTYGPLRQILNINRAPVHATVLATPVQQPAPAVTPPATDSLTMLYAFDWLIGADQPQSGVDAAVLKYVSGAWVLAQQPVVFFHVDGASSRPMQIKQTAAAHGLSTANTVALGNAAGAAWASSTEDDLNAFSFNCFDVSGRWWQATLPISGNDITISRSDDGLGDDWAVIATIGNYYEIFGMAAHPTNPDIIAIGALNNDTDHPQMVVTSDATSFNAFNLPVTDFSFSQFGMGGFVDFQSSGRVIVGYQYSQSVNRFVAVAYADDATDSGGYTAVEFLGAYTAADFFYRMIGRVNSDDSISVATIRETAAFGRPAMRVGISTDNGTSYTEIVNTFAAPNTGAYNFDDYLFHPGGICYFPTEDMLHLFGFPDAEEPDDHDPGTGYELATSAIDLAWKAATPLATPSWSSQSPTLRTLTGQDQPAFAYDAVSHL